METKNITNDKEFLLDKIITWLKSQNTSHVTCMSDIQIEILIKDLEMIRNNDPKIQERVQKMIANCYN